MNKLMNSDPHRVLIDVFDRGRRLCSEDLFHCVTLERKEGKRFGYKLERLEKSAQLVLGGGGGKKRQ